MMAAPVAVIIGAPLSEALLTLDGTRGLKGWQWLFLVEGLPAIVLGLLTLEVMSDSPAGWRPTTGGSGHISRDPDVPASSGCR
jgi:MFS family permease